MHLQLCLILFVASMSVSTYTNYEVGKDIITCVHTYIHIYIYTYTPVPVYGKEAL